MDHASTMMGPIMVHLTGNQSLGQELFLSSTPVIPDEASREIISRFFLNRFGHTFEQFRFTEEGSSSVLTLCRELLGNPEKLPTVSEQLARRLFDCSTHPRIKPGEFHVTTFGAYPSANGPVRAVGLFKTETKTGFLKVSHDGQSVTLHVQEGIDLNKFDKGCLILEADQEDPIVMIVDQHSRGEEAVYWREQFLGCEPRNTNYRQTTGMMQATREFVTGYLEQELDVSKADKIDLLNRSVSYFKSNEQFEPEEFEQNVLADPGIIRTFRRFNEEQEEPVFERGAAISAAAVKQQARVFRSVLKLDRNFHIYIHGNRELIQQGKDPDGRKFYKLYY
ncbi:MAG: nucleoid-associated protein, partial [Bacteroidota bacterium]